MSRRIINWIYAIAALRWNDTESRNEPIARSNGAEKMQTLPHLNSQNAAAVSKATARLGCLSTGIIGNGNSARALAAYLSSNGHSVHLLARAKEQLSFLGNNSSVKAEGKITGTFPISTFGTSSGEFAENSEVIFVATITTAYAEVAKKLAAHLTEKHKIILFSSKLGGTLVFEEALKKASSKIPRIMETDALFACRINESNNSIWIRGFKQWTLFSSATRSKTKEDAALLKRFFPDLSPAENIIQRGLTDFGAVAHAPIAMANMNLISNGIPFRFYYDGLTEETVRLLESVEEEFRSIAAAYGTDLIPMKDLLNRYYGCDSSSLYSAMTTVPNYKHSMGPDTLQHRFLHEDICSTLVPAQELARLAAIKTPVIDSLISIMSVITQRDLRSEGRSLASFGLDGMSHRQVFNYVNS